MPVRFPVRIALAGLALGLIFDRVVFDHPLGFGFPLFLALTLGALALTLKWERLAPLRENLWIFAPLLFFGAMIAVRANGFVTFLNLAAVLLLLGVIAMYLLREPLSQLSVPGFALSPLVAPLMAGLRGAQTSRLAAMESAKVWQGNRGRSWLPVARGLLLASPVVIIFAVMLSSADLMFAEVLRRLLPVDFVEFIQRLMVHGTVTLFVGFVLLGGLAYVAWREERSNEAKPSSLSFTVPKMLGLTESAVVLNAVNLLFAAFVVIQIPYLFGGQLNIDLGNVTYAEYARRGFGELVFTSVLVLGMLLALGTLTPRETLRQKALFNLSSTVMVGLTVVMLVSAFKRLLLYEEAYGFSEMRVYPHVFMVWLALLLGWFLVTLWLKPNRFAIGLVVACIGFVATLDVMNVDSFIVQQNVRRYELMGTDAFRYRDAYLDDYERWRATALERIDTSYLTRLSDDAIPALIEGVGRLQGQPKWNVEDHLEKRLRELQRDTTGRTWPSYHLSHGRAYALLSARFAAMR
jgi:hypothetical protein